MHTWPNLHPILEGIHWAVAGGVATRAYMPERMTQDLDIVIRRQDCGEVWGRFRDAGYTVAEALDAPYFVARTADGVEIDVICAAFPWLEEALAAPRQDPAGFPVLDLPYLILMKLLANRGVDLGDMTRMLGLAGEADLARVRAAISTFSPEDAEDLETLILLGKREMAGGGHGPEWHPA